MHDRIHPNPNQDVRDGEPTGLAVVNAIEELQTALANRYGVDHAFIVCGRGKILAAHSMMEGHVLPVHEDI
jgi:hypothetical protein